MSRRPFEETVLVVDDTEFMVKLLEDIFTGDGYRVVTARHAEEATRQYLEALPDIVTLDLVMPGADGIETLQQLRHIDPAARVIMVSSVGLEARVVEAIRLGARNYLLKPFDRDKVLDVVRRCLDEY